MNLGALLQQLRSQGVTLSRDGDALKVHANKGALTTELHNALTVHKRTLLDRIKETADQLDSTLPRCEPDPANLYEPFPLSDLQTAFYLANDPHMEFHVRPHYYQEWDVDDLDVNRYEAAWNKMLQRHFRELVTVRADGNLEVVKDPEPLRCSVRDLRGLSPEEVSRSLGEVRAQMMRTELPLDHWPWHDLRISLWRTQGSNHARIHYNHNSFFSDGYGTTRAFQEIDRYYRDPTLSLPPFSLSYRDAVLALDRLAQSAQGLAARRYWEERLPALPGPPALPLRPGMDRRCRSRLRRREYVMDSELWHSFKTNAGRVGLTPSNAVFAAYAEILAAWSNSRHFVLSNMMPRRLDIHPEIHDLLGNFVSLYPLEIDLRADTTFDQRAKLIQERVILDSQHRHWGGMQVMQALNRQSGGFGGAPLPFVIASGLALEGWKRSDFACLETPQVMLDHQFFELGDGRFQVLWDLLEEFFPDGMIDDMWAAYLGLIERLGRDAGVWESASFDLIPVRHLAQRQSVAPMPSKVRSGRLHELLRADAKRCALVTATGTLSYAELVQRASAIAGHLQRAGVCHGDTVAVVADRGPAMLQAVYGTLMAGAAYVPVDPALPDERRTFLLRNSEARHIITEARYADALQWPDDVPLLVADCIDMDGVPHVAVDGDQVDLAYVIYTSGSTGQPKGVMIDHRGAVNTIVDINQRFQVGADDRIFGVSSFGFDLSVYDIFGAGEAGATLVYPTPEQALNPAHWLDLLEREQVSIWNSAPPLAALMVDAAENRGVQLPHLRLVLLSGDWIPIDLPDRIRRIAPAAQVVSLGGATEASIWSIIYPVERVDPSRSSIPYGYPMRNQSWFVLDHEGRPVPEWVPGELYIGGIGLALGYWRDPEKTVASFIAHPRTGERIYRTGDIGRYLPDGAIEFLGRRDFQVKIHGHRIELGEIEVALLACADIAAAVVEVHKPDGGTPQLLAHVVPAVGITLTREVLQQRLARTLPDYMVPRLIQFLERLPLTGNGKVDRKALPRPEATIVANKAREEQRAPRDRIESELLRIWQRVLAQDGIDIDADFFDIGGQSMEAVRMIGMVREALGASLSLGNIWEDRTIVCLAERLRSGTRAPARCMTEISGRGEGEPLFLVHPAGGHVLCYRELGRLLARPVQAFQAPGSDGRTTPLESIEAFADTYLNELRQVQPDGPVMLGGWSSGALIAYEMAARLRAQGRAVEGVLIIDSPAPLVHEAVSDAELFHWFIGDLELPPALRAVLAQIDCVRQTEQQCLGRAATLMRLHGVALGSDAEQLAAIYRVFKGVVRASRNYHAESTDVDLLIVRAAQGQVNEFARHPDAERDDWGWCRFTEGHVDMRRTAGTHYTLLAPPAVQAIAAFVNQWIAGRDGEYESGDRNPVAEACK